MSNLTTAEIVKLYKESRNKVEEVQILAELTASDVETILAILQDEGVYDPDYRICVQCGNEYPRIYARQRICPECRENNKIAKKNRTEVARLELELKRNIVKIQELQREAEKIREKLRGYEQKSMRKV